MENLSSPLDTLRQLKEMLDAGALTPAEFETLKQRLVFSSEAPPTPPATPAAPGPLPPVVVPDALPMGPSASSAELFPPLPPAPVAPSAPITEPSPGRYFEPLTPPVTPAPVPTSLVYEVPAPVPVATPEYVPVAEPAPPLDFVPLAEYVPEQQWPTAEASVVDNPPARSPLALVLAIVGVLGLLALVLYLTSNRHPSERLSSTSQTAADSVAPTIDVGPQAAQLSQAATEPETVRVAPAHPAPVLLPRPPAPQVRDTAATFAPAPASSDSSSGR